MHPERKTRRKSYGIPWNTDRKVRCTWRWWWLVIKWWISISHPARELFQKAIDKYFLSMFTQWHWRIMRNIQKSTILKYLILLLDAPQTSTKHVTNALHFILSVKIGHKILSYFWHHHRKGSLMPLTYSFIFLYL